MPNSIPATQLNRNFGTNGPDSAEIQNNTEGNVFEGISPSITTNYNNEETQEAIELGFQYLHQRAALGQSPYLTPTNKIDLTSFVPFGSTNPVQDTSAPQILLSFRKLHETSVETINSQLREWNQAAQFLPQFKATDPRYASFFHMYRAMLYQNKGDSLDISSQDAAEAYKNALEDLNMAIDNDSQNPYLYYMRMTVREKLVNMGAISEEEVKSYQEQDQKQYQLLSENGYIAYNNKTAHSLKQDIQKAVEKGSFYDVYYPKKVEQYRLAGDYDKAIAVMQEFIKLNPDNELAYYDLISLKAQAGKLDEALADINKIIKSNPDNDLAYSKRASLRAQAGKLDKALADMDKAIKLNPDNDSYYLQRSELKKAAGDTLGAAVDYNRANYTYIDPKEISYVNQGPFGNCYFIATIAANPELLNQSRCIKRNSDGSYDITLYPLVGSHKVADTPQTFHVTQEDLKKNYYRRANGKKIELGSKQCEVLKALEIASFKSCKGKEDLLDNGNAPKSISMLFGPSGKVNGNSFAVTVNHIYLNALGIKPKNLVDSGLFISFCDGTKKKIKIGGQFLETNHAFIIRKYENGILYLSNPHGDKPSSTDDDIAVPFWDLRGLNYTVSLMVEKDEYNDENFLALQGVSAIQSGDYTKGIKYMKKALKKSPSNELYRYFISITYEARAKEKAMNGDRKGAKADLEQSKKYSEK